MLTFFNRYSSIRSLSANNSSHIATQEVRFHFLARAFRHRRHYLTSTIVLSLLLLFSASVSASVPNRTIAASTPSRFDFEYKTNQYIDVVGQYDGAVKAVAVRGDIVYVGVGPRIIVLDVHDVTEPKEVGKSDVLPELVEDILINGDHAFVANGAAGVQVLSLATLSRPAQIARIDTDGHVHSLALFENYLLIADGPAGMKIVDITAPAAPVPLSVYDTADNAVDVATSNHYSYVADENSGLYVFDIRDPAEPRLLTIYNPAGFETAVEAIGSWVYLAASKYGVLSVDMSTPTSPITVSAWALDTYSGVSDMTLNGGFLYVIDNAFDYGLSILDVRDPTRIAQRGYRYRMKKALNVAVEGGFAFATELGGSLRGEPYGDAGLRILDVRSPDNPRLVGTYEPLTRVLDVVIQNDFVYVADEASGFSIIDMSDPSQPEQITADLLSGGGAQTVVLDDEYAYISGIDQGAPLRILDVRNVNNVQFIGQFDHYYNDILVKDDYLYGVNNFRGLDVVNIRNPESPILIGHLELPGILSAGDISNNNLYLGGYSGFFVIDARDANNPRVVSQHDDMRGVHDVAVTDNYALVTGISVGTVVFDISEPANPIRIAEYDINGEGIAIYGSNAYIAAGFSGLHVLDIGDPRSPRLIASYDTAGYALDVSISADHVYLADRDGGVYIFYPPYTIRGRVINGVTNRALAGVMISNGPGKVAVTDSDGNYVMTGVPAGTYTMTASLPGWTFAPDPLPNTHHSQPVVITVPPGNKDVDFKGYDHEPIVFVHGWQGGLDPLCPNHDKRFFQEMDSYFENVDNYLVTAGYYVKHASLMTWTCWTESLGDNAVWLKDTIDRAKTATGRDSVILIAHSMGGLVSRAYIENDRYLQDGNEDVSKLITFGSPHLGVPADIMAVVIGRFEGVMGLSSYCAIYGPAVCEFTTTGMTVFNMFHTSRQGVEYYLVSGAAQFENLNTFGRLAFTALGGALGDGNDAAVRQSSGLGLEGNHYRLPTDEAHRISVGAPNYFSNRNGGESLSYRECLIPVLLDDDADTTCGEKSTFTSASQSSDTPLAVHTPLQYGTLLPGGASEHGLILEGGSTMIATRWLTGTVDVILVDPSGIVIDPAYADDHPNQVRYDADAGIAIYNLAGAKPGVWRVRLQAGSDFPDEGVSYNLLAFIDSAQTLSVEVDRLWYNTGDIALVTVSLSPPPVTAEISATILLADDVSEMVELAAVGGGKYQGSYTIPNVPGYAEARFIATGSLANGIPFERGKSTIFQISPNSAALSGVYSDTPLLRSPGSNYYGSLNVTNGITASIATTVTLSADLVDENGMVVAHANSTTAVNPGDSSLNLYFSGEDIYAARRDGPYILTHVLLVDQRGAALVLDQADDVHVTAGYTYMDFWLGDVFLPLILRQAHHVHGTTPTPTATLTPTTPAPTYTSTPSPTVTPTFQPSATPTRTPTSTYTPTPSLTPSPTPTVTPESSSDPVVFVEIEEGSIIQPLAIGSDSDASSCKYIRTIDDWSNGSVQLNFEVPSGGEYYLWARARGQGWGTNSFFMAVDNANEIHFEIVPVNETDWIWDWQRLYQEDGNFPFYLTAGQHTIRFRSREADADLDAFVVARSQEFEPDEITTCDQALANLIEFEERAWFI